MDFSARLRQLDRQLEAHAWLWRPQPFKQARPSWCERLPELTEALLQRSDDELQRLTEDEAALHALLQRHLPALSELWPLTRVPAVNHQQLSDPGPHFSVGVPGRKWQQIYAFSTALSEVRAPLLEWCGGKGHLGRLLAKQWRQSVLTLEIDEGLCQQGEVMAERSHVEQRFHQGDALQEEAGKLLGERHAVALHACGELHRTLVRRGVAQDVPALDIAPCCYHLHGGEHYRPMSDGLCLQLSRDDMRIAVTETVTAVGREVRQRDTEMAWKLGFNVLRGALSGDDEYRPLKPIDKRWLGEGFAGFCRRLAEREGVSLMGHIDWEKYESLGWQRQREVMRLSLVRHAFRRAIEMWLVLDLASYLQSNGYAVKLSEFCVSALTPRNILISARRC